MRSQGSVGYNPTETRRVLLEAAAEEIWRSGFRAASLSVILKKTGVTKGALYHHFKNKKELGYAVVDELLRTSIHQSWIEPLEGSDDPIGTLMVMLQDRLEHTVGDLLKYGCPLGNLAYEMSPLDEGFRLRVGAVFQEWRDALEGAFLNGQACHTVKPTMNPQRAASFIVSAIEGATCTAKGLQDRSVLEDCLTEFSIYLSLFQVSEQDRGER